MSGREPVIGQVPGELRDVVMDRALRPPKCRRAWVEVDLDALAGNAAALQAILPEPCKLMAVVKTDAYRHGAKRVALRLMREGFDAFAVASAREGADLRKEGLEGEVLVLGYTPHEDAWILSGYELTQLVADGVHAKSLNETGFRLDIHIAVDTGLHRLGIEPANIDEIEAVYKCKNLRVTGVATHFASSDSLDDSDVDFTNLQIERYVSVLDYLRGRGYDTGKLHAQASFGILNYPDLKYDYARAGIAMYGVKSHYTHTVTEPDLQPVLSLKAIVAQVRWIGEAESVSYGRAFTSNKPLKLATVCAGYADGIPRQISGKSLMCLIRGKRVPIIGRICMDLLMTDVSEVDSVAAGDIVTLIGKDVDDEIRCEEVADAAGTITNDILCRLGKRLPRIYIEKTQC